MNLETFYAYHANNGGKLLAIWIAGKLENLTLAQFKKLTATFTLTSSETSYKVKNGIVLTK
jgi:hypothetical protein